jgi:hypothetical protein
LPAQRHRKIGYCDLTVTRLHLKKILSTSPKRQLREKGKRVFRGT